MLEDLEETPEPIFRTENDHQPFRLLWDIEQRRYSPEELDALRITLPDAIYWQCEARRYSNELCELIWRDCLKKYEVEDVEGVQGVAKADGWRNVATAYKRRLKRQGCTTKQLRDFRLLITDERHWKPEAELLRQVSARRERERQEKYLEQNACVQGLPSPAQSEVYDMDLQRKPRPARRSQRICKQLGGNKAADDRWSGLRSRTASRVGKRSGRGKR
ncbi:uncharacterized protein PV07_12534 [Cladophialophora immunda]|uniref:Uncharacterized protein n=1 Tax=Cladophialophora immunda TaxID=569365 RepID=A0A0D2ABE3_9EURO|nr:uncharacterized protein PV07_12534 [Cladophialophora immunda]KIW22072.1 hypothetical protein PV07_12534 [Cladophialophora immunda]